MDPHIKNNVVSGNSGLRYLYLLTVFFLTLTGFGQMPIFKRYYIADIPGLGWLAKFYVTHYIHYLGAILFLALAAYLVVDFLVLKRKKVQLTRSGYLRGAIFTGILVSGVILVIRNLEGTPFSSAFIITMDLMHLGLVMMFLLASVFCLVTGKRWVTPR
jgi:hypothetical protein